MRVTHTLWRASNGWILIPDDSVIAINATDAPKCAVFKTLKEFSDQYPKRERRNRKPKPTTTETK